MKSKLRLLTFLLLLFSASAAFSQNAIIAKEDNEIPPKSYIKQLKKEADAALKVKVVNVHLDSCKTCTSTGVLYVVEAEILKKYFYKGKKTEENYLIYTTAADTSLYRKSKELIVFLNRIEKKDIEKFKSIGWTARQATEFKYTIETESYIK
ncbi:MAG: hypothetical protein V4608_00565 [Bacteroidota bacterium]